MIRAGSHGSLSADGDTVLRCTDWTLTIDRELKPQTPLHRWKERSVPLKRSARGELSVLYDPADAGASALIDSFRADEPPPVALELRTSRDTGYDLQAHVSAVGTVVAAKDAHRVKLSFTATGPVVPV